MIYARLVCAPILGFVLAASQLGPVLEQSNTDESGRGTYRQPSDQVRVSWNYDPEVSWYGATPEENGGYTRTACGLPLSDRLAGVAHRTLPCGTLVEFRWKDRVLTVPVTDRGPYVEGRQFDLTRATCKALRHCFTGPIYWRIVNG